MLKRRNIQAIDGYRLQNCPARALFELQILYRRRAVLAKAINQSKGSSNFKTIQTETGAGSALLLLLVVVVVVERRTLYRKVANSSPRHGAARVFSSSELTFCADSYSVSVPPRVTPLHANTNKRTNKQTNKKSVILSKSRWHVTPENAHTLDPSKSE